MPRRRKGKAKWGRMRSPSFHVSYKFPAMLNVQPYSVSVYMCFCVGTTEGIRHRLIFNCSQLLLLFRPSLASNTLTLHLLLNTLTPFR